MNRNGGPLDGWSGVGLGGETQTDYSTVSCCRPAPGPEDTAAESVSWGRIKASLME